MTETTAMEKNNTQLPRNMQTNINKKILWIKQNKKCRINESTSCNLSVNDFVRLNARIYKVLHMNSNIGYCLRVKEMWKKADNSQTKRLETDKKKTTTTTIFILPRREIEKERKNLLKMRATLFKPFSLCSPLFFDRKSYWTESEKKNIIISNLQWNRRKKKQSQN